ncbi:hypothetical protein ACHMW5_26995 [Azospirillum melinis]|uniref:hypothetical protein n=1 Tax=Azospirillum melinis TaxID=328839 RepID=UPI0037568898
MMRFEDEFRGIRRRSLLGLAACGLMLPAFPLAAAVPAFRITMVLGRGESDNEHGFKDYLARHGLKVDYIIRDTGGDPARLPAIVEEIKDTRPDLVYSFGTPQTRGIVGPFDDADPRRHVTDIPVVFDKAMLALASSAYGIGRLTASKAAQILIDRTDPADIPVETLKRFSVIINMATVRILEYCPPYCPPIGLLNFAEIIEP